MARLTKAEYKNLLTETARSGGFPSSEAFLSPYGHEWKHRCKYRTKDGRKCAIGLIMPDDQYKEMFDASNTLPTLINTAVDKLYHKNLITNGWFPEGLTVSDLVRIQCCHDWNVSVDGEGNLRFNTDKFLANLNELPCFAGVGDDAQTKV